MQDVYQIPIKNKQLQNVSNDEEVNRIGEL